MSTELAFVGDIHGNVSATMGLVQALEKRCVSQVVFLGDYINKGPDSARVIQRIIDFSRSRRVVLLRGNHEAALIDALDTFDLAPFLKIGGAKTIRSYAGTNVPPDVLSALISAMPRDHVEAFRRMDSVFETQELIAQHEPLRHSTGKFRITAHIPVGPVPRVTKNFAHIDTGCGTDGGRLTALLWPSLEYIQVNAFGEIVVDKQP
ncbi:metallophosphoesterase [Nakamurella sp.]|uniref:metallophosphoesterase n=1 Tax=Nakamurella sp. TaxID=1869182 RepID=UPI003B3BBDAC